MYTAAHSLLYTNILFLSASDLTQMELFKVMVTSKTKLAFLLQYVQYIKIILRRNSCIALAINYIDSKIKCNIEENLLSQFDSSGFLKKKKCLQLFKAIFKPVNTALQRFHEKFRLGMEKGRDGRGGGKNSSNRRTDVTLELCRWE